MQTPGRRYLCARCRCAVLICSHCDRGNRYCTPKCAKQARRQAQRAAGKRYQADLPGRTAHAKRQSRYRAKKQIHRSHAPAWERSTRRSSVSRTTSLNTISACEPAGQDGYSRSRVWAHFAKRRQEAASRHGHAGGSTLTDRDAGASVTAFPRWRVGTIRNSELHCQPAVGTWPAG